MWQSFGHSMMKQGASRTSTPSRASSRHTHPGLRPRRQRKVLTGSLALTDRALGNGWVERQAARKSSEARQCTAGLCACICAEVGKPEN